MGITSIPAGINIPNVSLLAMQGQPKPSRHSICLQSSCSTKTFDSKFSCSLESATCLSFDSDVGFKNVSLGNVLSAKAPNEPVPFIAEDDLVMYQEHRDHGFEVQV